IVFSIDSVITAVALADHLIIMVIAVMLAVFLMMIFINPVSEFINRHPEMKMLALTFIVVIGGLLILDSLGFHAGYEVFGIGMEKAIVYFAMLLSVIIVMINMAYNKNLAKWKESIALEAKADDNADASDDEAGDS
ncbi:MAG: TerC family protein, partial [Coriobacteriia bacterium]|nr:TerC family protein [Coriobacteriia bacterium]